MVDAQGRAATHTGALCIPAAGGQEGKEYVVQANLMDKPTVWPAMARAYEARKGDLAERLLAALDAAQAEGGDIRGRQSAAIVVVKAARAGAVGGPRLRPARRGPPEPLVELRRLVGVQRGYNHMTRATTAWRSRTGRAPSASTAPRARSSRSTPRWLSGTPWRSPPPAGSSRRAPLFAQAFKADPRWRELVKRLPDVKQLPKDKALLDAIVAIQ
jgi:hypothetical protein